MKLSRRLAIVPLLLGAAALFDAGNAHAGFPERPVTIVVPYPAGGGTDTIARKLARVLADEWRVSVIVENAPGAEGLIGTERVLRSPADGYTLLFQISQMMLWKKTMPNSKVDALRDFRYVSKIQTSPLAFGISPKLPVKSFKEYVQWCTSNKGECDWGSGSAYAQLVGRQLMDVAGIADAVNVPYKGTAPMMNDVAGGHIAMAVPAVTSSLAQIKGGLFHLLAVGSDQRSSQVPDTPTLRESGYDVHGETWYGLLVDKDTPQDAFDIIVAGVRAAGKDQALVDQIKRDGGEPVFSTPQEFTREIEEESLRLDKLLDKYWVAQ